MKSAGTSFVINKSDGQRLAALHFQAATRPARAEVIVCHGFSGGKENGGRIHTFGGLLNEMGLNVTAFDFTGAGGSDGDFATVSLSRQAGDLREVMDYVRLQSGLPLILLGRSFGGSTALAAGASDDRVKAFIFWSTPFYLHSTFGKFVQPSEKAGSNEPVLNVSDDSGSYQLDPVLFQDFERHDMNAYAKSIAERAVLVIHGGQDQVVDSSDARALAEASNASLHIVPDADHQFTAHVEYREKLTIDWLGSVLAAMEAN